MIAGLNAARAPGALADPALLPERGVTLRIRDLGSPLHGETILLHGAGSSDTTAVPVRPLLSYHPFLFPLFSLGGWYPM